MMNRNALHIALIAALTVSATLASGCKKKEPEVTITAPRPSAPAAPRWSLSDIDMDARVQFPDRSKPTSQDLAQAVADFASALVQGDDDAFEELLSPDGQVVLDALRESGAWETSTAGLRAVRICRIDEPGGAPVLALGIEDNTNATLLAWNIENAGEAYMFSPMPIAAPTADRIAMLDDAPLDPPSFSSGGAIEAPVVVNRPPEEDDDKKKPGRRQNRPRRGRAPSSPAPSGPTPEAPR